MSSLNILASISLLLAAPNLQAYSRNRVPDCIVILGVLGESSGFERALDVRFKDLDDIKKLMREDPSRFVATYLGWDKLSARVFLTHLVNEDPKKLIEAAKLFSGEKVTNESKRFFRTVMEVIDDSETPLYTRKLLVERLFLAEKIDGIDNTTGQALLDEMAVLHLSPDERKQMYELWASEWAPVDEEIYFQFRAEKPNRMPADYFSQHEERLNARLSLLEYFDWWGNPNNGPMILHALEKSASERKAHPNALKLVWENIDGWHDYSPVQASHFVDQVIERVFRKSHWSIEQLNELVAGRVIDSFAHPLREKLLLGLITHGGFRAEDLQKFYVRVAPHLEDDMRQRLKTAIRKAPK